MHSTKAFVPINQHLMPYFTKCAISVLFVRNCRLVTGNYSYHFNCNLLFCHHGVGLSATFDYSKGLLT